MRVVIEKNSLKIQSCIYNYSSYMINYRNDLSRISLKYLDFS